MNLLLDTHVLLWAISNDPALSKQARKLLVDKDTRIFYSVISLWEVEIKHNAHPDRMMINAEKLKSYCERSGFTYCGFKDTYIYQLSKLRPKSGHTLHGDPFDRMLLCQSKIESMSFMTHDRAFSFYDLDNIILI